MSGLSGFSNQKKLGKSEFVTVQSAGSDKKAINTAQMYLADLTGSALTISAVTQSNDKKITYIDFGAAHGARINDVVRMSTGTLIQWEFDVIEVPSASIVGIWNIAPTLPLAAEDAKLCRWVTAKADGEGALQVSQGPTQFTRDGLTQTVIEDTAVPANNRPLPAGLYIVKDGVVYPVTKDTGTPANTVAIPVELSGVAGPVNITAGDLNVQLSDLGANFDSSRLGDGSGIYLEINADGSINVVDAAAAAKLDTLIAKDFATSAKQDAEALLVGAVNEAAPGTDTANSGLNGRLQRIAQRLTSLIALLPASLGQKASAGSLPVVLSTEQEAKVDLIATSAKQDAQSTLIGALVETAPASDTASSGLNGRLQRIAQRLTSLIALLPASLGQKLMASSFAVTIASDQSALSTTPTAMVGSYQQDLTVSDAAVETFTAPIGSKWVLLQADELNTGNIRVKIGAAATTTSGMVLQPGRDMKLDCGGDVSYTSEVGGSGKLYAQFGV
jgi:hypothetical protein